MGRSRARSRRGAELRSLMIFLVGVVLAVLINLVTDLFPVSDTHPAVRWWLLGVVIVVAAAGGVLSWPRAEHRNESGDSAPRQVIHNAQGPVVGEISGGTVSFHQGGSRQADLPQGEADPPRKPRRS